MPYTYAIGVHVTFCKNFLKNLIINNLNGNYIDIKKKYIGVFSLIHASILYFTKRISSTVNIS